VALELRGWRVRRRVTHTAVALCVLLTFSGCAGSGYTYVAEEQLGVYFRVPEQYTVFGAEEVQQVVAGDLPAENAGQLQAQQWAVSFDASDSPRVDAFLTQVRKPVDSLAGFARVRALDERERLGYSLNSLRNELIPSEELQQGGRLRILGVEEVSQDGGQGLHLAFALELADGTLIIDQTALVDPATRRVYLLALGCSSRCYEASRDDIAAIRDSWTIEER
jgi:hypothetical protein